MFSLPCVLIVAAVTAAAPPETAAKWEYAELAYRDVPARPARDARPARTGPDGQEIPATPAVPATPATVAIRWTTGGDEADLNGWGELAGKLNAPAKKDASASLQRVQVLNALGAGGWELVAQQEGMTTTTFTDRNTGRGGFGGVGGGGTRTTTSPTGSTLLFKRRLP